MAEMMRNIVPFAATHPGEILDAELDARGIKQNEFARAIGISTTHLNEFIKGKRNMNAELAIKFESELGISSDIWMRLQSNYEVTLARIRERDEKEQEAAGILELIGQIVDLITIKKEYNYEGNKAAPFLEWFKKNFHVKTPSDLNASMVELFRKSEKANTEELMARTWVLIAREHASRISVRGSFLREKGEEIANGLSYILHENENTIARVTDFLSENGIRFCIVKKVKNAAIDGYSEIIDGIPTIVLTQRIDRIDNFAFSLMHEMGHINLHLLPKERKGCLTFAEHEKNKEEREADLYASSHLIPDSLWKSAPESRPIPSLVQKKYSLWAQQNKLNKWIVLGRVSHESGIYAFTKDRTRKVN
ncbi:MAG: HigA family addiction module antidote protein [Bacteroidales bacterium]|nr:HigA family addiction module antidote protein [Bacteroidales bacterium]